MFSVEAYLDDYLRITVEVSNEYYQGQCDFFTVIDENFEIIENVIEEKIKKQNSWSYTLILSTPCNLAKNYEVVVNQGYRAPLFIRGLVLSQQFDEEFYYDKDDLGARVFNDETTFKCWAPTATKVNLLYTEENQTHYVSMKRSKEGVYWCSIAKNLHQTRYVYQVYVNGDWNQTIDPYAFSSDTNAKHSVVIDFEQCNKPKFSYVECSKATDAIIYEVSIRDMTISSASGTKEKGTFNALREKGSLFEKNLTGFDYIKDLGISHVQLLPVCDFATVEESNPQLLYNWGYDPLQYRSLEGSYSSDSNNGVVRCNEFLQLVDSFHQEHIGVIMDVVFNHHYDARLSAFNSCVPYYYFRMRPDYSFSNGTFCGNDIESKRKMVKKFIVDTCLFFVNRYKVDGFRFDLMGILDVETVNELVEKVKKINPNALIYGEGWDMPTALIEQEKACIKNSEQMPQIAFFNDVFRDVLKGKNDPLNHGGYLSGNLHLQKEMKFILGDREFDEGAYCFKHPKNSINYVECHDNLSLWDKLTGCLANESQEIIIKRQKLCNALVLLAPGIPFIHAGQEFCRTKNGHDNTYNMSDEINQIDWPRSIKYKEVITYTKELIAIRKHYQALRLESLEECRKHIRVSFDNGLLIYHFIDLNGLDNINELAIIVNVCDDEKIKSVTDYWCIFNNQTRTEERVNEVKIQAYSLAILTK